MKYYKNFIILVFISILIGIVVGIINTIFGKILILMTEIRQGYYFILIPFLALVGIIIVYCYNRFGNQCSKGVNLIFMVAQNKEDKIPLKLIPFVIISTWATHLFGGSAGREGVAIQIGATFSNWLGNKININKEYKKTFLIVGMAAGFSALFQTPVAAIFFALEVLVIGKIYYQALLPTIIASFTASTISNLLGLERFTYKLALNISINFIGILKLILLGIIFGLIGYSFSICLKYTKQFFINKIKNDILRIFVISLILSIIFLTLHNGRYSGLGTNLINYSFNNGQIYTYDWILKFILTIVTLSIGFIGGEVTPLFSIGTSLGVILANIFNLPVEFIASLGYISVFSSATNTFLAPIFIGGEIFGYEYMPYFFLTVSFAYIFNFNKSIYLLQE